MSYTFKVGDRGVTNRGHEYRVICTNKQRTRYQTVMVVLIKAENSNELSYDVDYAGLVYDDATHKLLPPNQLLRDLPSGAKFQFAEPLYPKATYQKMYLESLSGQDPIYCWIRRHSPDEYVLNKYRGDLKCRVVANDQH